MLHAGALRRPAAAAATRRPAAPLCPRRPALAPRAAAAAAGPRRAPARPLRRVPAAASSAAAAAGDDDDSDGDSLQPALLSTDFEHIKILDTEMVFKWLRQYVPFSQLSPEAVHEVAELMEVQLAPQGKLLQRLGNQPDAFIVVRQGVVRVQDVTTTAEDGSAQSVDAGPGALFNLAELILGQGASATVRTATQVTLWVVPADAIRQLAARRPDLLLELAARRPDLLLEVGLRLSQEMMGRINALTAEKQEDERRQRALAPYLVAAPKRGVIGTSKYAERLRKQIVEAARDPLRRPVLVFGEPGLNKDNFAGLVHFGSKNRGGPLVELDCTKPGESLLAELLGRGSKEGLLHWVGGGAVMLKNVHKAPPAVLFQISLLLKEGMYQPLPFGWTTINSMDLPRPPQKCAARILLTAAQRVPALDGLVSTIAVPPLRVRPADILDLEQWYLKDVARTTGVRLTLTPEAERQLQAYAFPGNTEELFGLVARAATQSIAGDAKAAAAKGPKAAGGGASAALLAAAAPVTASGDAGDAVIQLDKDVFWVAAKSTDRFKVNLLTSLPLVRNFLRGDFFPEGLNHGFTKYAFAVIVVALFIGPQDREHNVFLNFFWDWWWPGIFLVYPFLGRIWCSVCPFMIYGEIVQRWRESSGVTLKKWPRDAMEKWGGWFLWGLFAAILIWEEVWDLPQNAALSSCLLLLITAGAMVGSYFYERRIWCRYLCPVGGMNGLFAKLSMIELRARQGVCSGTCDTYHCYKGGPAEGEGMDTGGCPVYSHPAQLTDNRNCVLCMTCLKACPHRSIEIRLRPPGIDLWTTHQPTWYEVYLMFMLMGAVYLHRLPELEAQFGVDPALFAPKLPHILASAAIMAVPGALAWAFDAAGRAALAAAPAPAAAAAVAGGGGGGGGRMGVGPPAPFLSLCYGYLPLVWGATLAHYEQYFLEEAGTILPAAARTFHLDALAATLPFVEAHPAVVAFVQGSTLLASAGLTLVLTRRLAGGPWASVAPQCAAVALFTAEFWYLIVR
ncbi:MAG: cyclic nucleotide-binding protein [Monoraphidium minutum]|nr:MAG: cyclic nucleotide-binding protein [Monoraphidium minutum]